MGTLSTESELLDNTQTKVLRVFFLAIHLYSFALRFLFFKLTQPLTVSPVQLLVTVKEKGGKPDRKLNRPSLWFTKSIQKPEV
jgi:hypothetical protein